MGLLPVQGIGLEPLFTTCNPVGCGRRHNSISAGVQIGNDRLARQRGEGYSVRFILRAGNDHTCDSQRTRGAIKPDRLNRGNRAGIDIVVSWIGRSRQAVRQRHVKHVVSGLSGRITRAARVVEKRDLKAAETCLVGRQHVNSAAAIVLAVQREVVLEHKYREFRRWERSGLRQHLYRQTIVNIEADRSAAHAVAAVSGC